MPRRVALFCRVQPAAKTALAVAADSTGLSESMAIDLLLRFLPQATIIDLLQRAKMAESKRKL